jgi:beta-galactosidase
MLLMLGIVVAKADTRRVLFDAGWQFTQNGKTVTVDLPHDWDIYAGPDAKSGATGTGGGWYPGGKGEYRKTFKTPDGEVVRLHFEGVYQKAEVFINGQKAGQHAYGYTPFTIDITPYLHQDKPNEVLVKVDNSEQPNCRWYSGSGIYRHVWLITSPALHIAENGVYISTPMVNDDEATVQVEVTVENASDVERTATVMVGAESMPVTVPAKGSETDTLTFNIRNPRLWSPDTPILYEVRAMLKEQGKMVDSQLTRFGVRHIYCDSRYGFQLNYMPLLINGACVHHDDGILGAMAFDAAEIRKVRLMKDAGFNLIRTSHNPPSRAFLDACDSIGMLVIDEAFDGWRQAKTPYDYSTLIDSCYREDIHAMVRRDRNHPSVICWSIGNEVMERKDIRVVTTARKMKDAIKDYCCERPVTEALCSWDSDWEIYDPHAEVLDIAGYNYMLHKHASDHERDPLRVILQTESFPRDAWRNWQTVEDYSYVIGDIVWTGLDYLGESGIGRYYYDGDTPGEHYVEGGQPEWHGAYCGDVDITGWRKPISHYRELLWNRDTAPVLYMAVKEPDGYYGTIRETAWSVWPTWESWTWNSWEGKPVEVEVYTSLPSVRLYLNDRLVGEQQSAECKAVFTLPYQPGTLRAEGVTEEGQPVSVSLSTAGEPCQIRLTADKSTFLADGQDLIYVTAEILDRNGLVCPDAAIPLTATVKGAGSLLSFASADLKDTSVYTDAHCTTWKGRALLAVRSSAKSGSVSLTVKGDGLSQSQLTLNATNRR